MLQSPVIDFMALARAVAKGYLRGVPGCTQEDLVQEAALAMLKAVPMLPFDEAEKRRLQDRARTHLFNLLRSQTKKPRVLTLEGYDRGVGEGIDREVGAVEAADRAIAGMTPRQRDVTRRGYVGGQEDDTIVEETGMSIVAVRVARSQAVGVVREALR